MEPSVSIHHFVHPAWFEEKGGWTKEANIDLFVNFAVEAFKRFGQHAKLWSSFNEPTVFFLLSHAAQMPQHAVIEMLMASPASHYKCIFCLGP